VDMVAAPKNVWQHALGAARLASAQCGVVYKLQHCAHAAWRENATNAPLYSFTVFPWLLT
jgi:hypothetical protein